MNTAKLSKFDRIEIVWKDSEHCLKSWCTQDEYKKWIDNVTYYKQIGYYIETTDEQVVTADGFSAFRDGEVSQLSGINTIPKGCIKSVKKL